MSTDFYLVRHAEKQKGTGDVSISPLGIQQARMTAAYFRKMPISRICCSPLQRAKQTAGFIAEAVNQTILEDTRLRERANWGDLLDKHFRSLSRCGITAPWKEILSPSRRLCKKGRRALVFLHSGAFGSAHNRADRYRDAWRVNHRLYGKRIFPR